MHIIVKVSFHIQICFFKLMLRKCWSKTEKYKLKRIKRFKSMSTDNWYYFLYINQRTKEKNLTDTRSKNWNREQKSCRTGPRTGRCSKSVLEPDQEPLYNLSQFITGLRASGKSESVLKPEPEPPKAIGQF